jgi:endonuclease/exonuclease/phosphatase family metal-dependent hydrolase
MLFISFNVRCGNANDGVNHWDNRAETATRFIVDLAPDILGLQEPLSFQVAAFAQALPDYDWVGVGRDDGGFGGEFCPIFVRRDQFQILEHGTFWLSDTPEVVGSRTWGNRCVRICTWAKVTSADEQVFWVYNCHLDHESQLARERAAEQILSDISHRAGNDPVVWMGDFNASESNSIIPTLSAQLTDTYRTLHPDGSARTFTGFDDHAPLDKIDYIWASRNWKIEAAEILTDRPDGRFPSDHEPITARLRLPE